MKVLLKTFGCQMNVYDSQVAAGMLEKAGFVVVNDDHEQSAESNEHRAKSIEHGKNSGSMLHATSSMPDVVLLNTCSVRDHAEQRVWGRLGKLGVEKKANPDLLIGLMGCMVEEHREALFKRFPQLDFMIGTRNIKELPVLIRQVMDNRQKVSKIKQDGISIEYSEFTKRDSPFHAWLPIMTGCNKECTFCIVPKLRGSEVSMPAGEVCREARRLVADGVKWITLLGQNVNSYGATKDQRQTTNDFGRQSLVVSPNIQKPVSFPMLLELLCKIEGMERISFTTSHPSDATEELFQAIARNPKIGRRFHLPLQSGSDKILRRMKRLHTCAGFKAKVDRLRELVPEISVTTDIIVGFPGETEEDHQATKRALEEIRFDGAFIYKYSARPGTPAEKLPDDVPTDVKAARNNELLAVQRAITEEKNRKLVGMTVGAFVEAKKGTDRQSMSFPRKRESRNGSPIKTFGDDDFGHEWFGRTDQDKRVLFSSREDLCGKFVKLKLTELRHETFRGELA